MTRSQKAAKRIQDLYCVERLSDLNLENAIYGQGLELRTRKMKGAQGQLIRHGNRGIVVVSEAIEHLGQRRFVLAHELGHWEMHKDLQIPAHIDSETEFLAWHSSHTQHEREANEFASELLMPEKYFKLEAKKKELSAQLINHLAKTFDSSLSAAAIRFAQIGSEPILVVFSIGGAIKWMHSSSDFRFGVYGRLPKPPAGSLTYKYYHTGLIAAEPETVLAETWFCNDFKVEQKYYLYEHLIPFKNINGCLTLIWEHEENHVVDDDEEKYFSRGGKKW
jgi:hypothetical protein